MLLRAFFLRRALNIRILRQLGFPAFTQEMQIDSVKNQPALRSVPPNVQDVFSSEIATAQDNYVIFRAALAQMLADALNVRMVDDFDAVLPDFIRVGSDGREIVWPERDAVPETAQQL